MEDKAPHSKDPPPTQQKWEGSEMAGNYSDCFRFATKRDHILLFSGILLAFLAGSSAALFALVSGLAASAFDTRLTPDEVHNSVRDVIIYFFVLGIGIFLGIFGSRSLLRVNAQRQGLRIRQAYLSALLHKESSFYDKINSMEISSQVEIDCKAVTDALDVQLESVVYTLGAWIFSLIVSFLRSWQITLMAFAAIPFLVGIGILFQILSVKIYFRRSAISQKAGAIAEESFTNIRTVVSLGGEKTQIEKFDSIQKKSQKELSKLGIYQGIAFACAQTPFYIIFPVVLYIGSFYIEDEKLNPVTGRAYTAADIFTPLMAVIVSFSQMYTLNASLKGISNAKVKIKKILDIVDSVKSSETATNKIDNFTGSITFNNVTFAYPRIPEKNILQNFNLRIKPNMKVAFVGESGSGKSTIVQLLQRFYDPQAGSIELDGQDIKTLDNSWLRRHLAYVGQEPVIFSMTVRENLLLAKPDATENEIVQALKTANAYNFVMDMENKIDTYIGGGAGSKLSGGQKQRLAIARAILKDPQVLLLDEATSALDSLSEKEVQKTLDNLPRKRTIIIIAHRLSTVQAADIIFMLDNGKIVEQGTHSELIALEGRYHKLLKIQSGVASSKDPSDRETKTHVKESTDPFNQDWEEEEEDRADDEHHHLVKRKQSNEISDKSQNKVAEEDNALTWGDIRRFWSLTKGERIYFLLGIIASIGVAASNILSQIGNTVTVGIFVDVNDPNFRQNVNFWCILQMIGAAGILVIVSLQLGFFAVASEAFLQFLKANIFSKFLRMEIGWHDDPSNNPGSLATRLEADTAYIAQFINTSFAHFIVIIAVNIIAIVTCFAAAWQPSLVGIWIFPIVMLTAWKTISKASQEAKRCQVPSAKAEAIISESINNLKTIMSLNAEDRIIKEYTKTLREIQKIELKGKVASSSLEAGMFFLMYIFMAAAFWVGSELNFSSNLSPSRIFVVVFSLWWTTNFSNAMFYLIPAVGKALHSIKQAIGHIDRKSQIDIEDPNLQFRGKIKGNIEFKNVKFSYPTRRTNIFTDLNFKVKEGKQIGITGPSGCGKSTIIQLLLRFYDVDAGEILIEDVNIKEYDLKHLRKEIGGVFQEPVLFYGTIEENLKYAQKEISFPEMRDAARKANALKFIETNATSEKEEMEENTSLKSSDGFQRLVGAQGGQLSGGQKQRLAIARAILRKPKVLLLDEATSALDAQSEAMVQDAINKVSQGLTTICVAHKFDTIKAMDEILLLKDGVVAERGSFEELIDQKGYFYKLKEGANNI